jgi:hypothetical protein
VGRQFCASKGKAGIVNIPLCRAGRGHDMHPSSWAGKQGHSIAATQELWSVRERYLDTVEVWRSSRMDHIQKVSIESAKIGGKVTRRKSRMFNYDLLEELQFWRDFLTPTIHILAGDGETRQTEGRTENRSWWDLDSLKKFPLTKRSSA